MAERNTAHPGSSMPLGFREVRVLDRTDSRTWIAGKGPVTTRWCVVWPPSQDGGGGAPRRAARFEVEAHEAEEN